MVKLVLVKHIRWKDLDIMGINYNITFYIQFYN